MDIPLGGFAGASMNGIAQSNGRGLPSNPAQGIRRLPSSIPPPPPPPVPNIYNVAGSNSSSSTLSASGPVSTSQVVALARQSMNKALEENQTQAAEASEVSTELRPGVTIDLSRKNIRELPDEVVDVIKNELERLALSHNQLTTFPNRFAECTSLRYLNVRNNQIREFPLPLCDLRSLEILDLGRNKIRILPPEIVKLASLKVFAVQKNRIEELPLCLADMVSLQVLKLDGNPITFPPKEVFQVQASSPPNDGFLKENEVTEVTVTAHIKRFLKQKALSSNGRLDTDNTGDESSEGAETPRIPVKRAVSGRFPVKVNGSEVPDLRSPNMPRPPPIPTRSHWRGLSQQSNTIRRPSVMPLTIGNANERLRSNSETLLQASRAERPSDRQRRMAIASKKANDLGTLDETQANNRFSHYRGLSHGSSMQGNINANIGSVISPASPAEPLLSRPNYVRRLSVLPEQRRESKMFDPVVEAAKGILYSIFQIHPMIQLFTRLTSDGTAKRSSLEIVFYNTNVHVEELEQEIQKHELFEGDDYALRENENVQRAVLTLVNAYSHVCSLLESNMETIIARGDPRYIRSLMMTLHNSIMELRVTASESALPTAQSVPQQAYRRPGFTDTIKPQIRDNSATPTADRPGVNMRSRNGTMVHNPSNLRVETDVPVPNINGMGRTATVTSATPRSGESFASGSSDRNYSADFTAEDRLFEKVFLSLQKASDLVMRTLPNINVQFQSALRSAMAQRAPDSVYLCWKTLIAQCLLCIQHTEMLKSRLSVIKLKEPGIRTQGSFWALSTNFLYSWADFAFLLKNCTGKNFQLPNDTGVRLRPIHLSVKETLGLITNSPWSYFTRQQGSSYETASNYSPNHYSSPSGSQQMQLPLTPQSAALGPAAQATVPSTPQSASFASAFNGGIFERADALISMGGLSMSRTNTLTSSSAASFGTNSSMTSFDDRGGPASMLSPNGNFGPPQYRSKGPF